MYYIAESEELYQAFYSINNFNHSKVLQEVEFLLNVWESQYGGSRLMFAAPSEIIIYLHEGNYSHNKRDILFDHRSIDYNRLAYFKMRAMIDLKNYEDSITFASDVEKYNPISTDLKVLMAYAFIMMGDYNAALHHARKTLGISFEPSQIGHGIWLMGKAYEMLGEGELANESFIECGKWLEGIGNNSMSALHQKLVCTDEKKQMFAQGDKMAEAFSRTLKNTYQNEFVKIHKHFALTLLQIDRKGYSYGLENIENTQDKEMILKREYLLGEMEKYIERYK